MASIATTAVDFLKSALPEAREAGLLPNLPRQRERITRPRPEWYRYPEQVRPWPDWYPALALARSPVGEPFRNALREAYPARFPDPETAFPWRDPAHYAAALLRAVVAGSVVAELRPYATSRIAREMIVELERVLSLPGQACSALWVVSDLDLADVDGEAVGDVELLGPRDRIRTVSRLLPEALHVGEGYSLPGEPFQGLLYASMVTERNPGMESERKLNEPIGRVLTALRLATAMTGHVRTVFEGEPSMIHAEVPQAHEQQRLGQSIFESRFRRVAEVQPEHLQGLRKLASLLATLDVGEPKALPAVVIAIRRFGRSYREEAPWADNVLDLATALEASMGPRSKEEIALTLRTRVAHLLAHDDSEQAGAIYDDVQDLYILRSDIIHGRARLRKSMTQLATARGLPPDPAGLNETHPMLDRWRDVVRRSICARLLLADLWPLTGDEPDVDRALVRRSERDVWHEKLAKGATEYGLPLLATGAPPLVDQRQS